MSFYMVDTAHFVTDTYKEEGGDGILYFHATHCELQSHSAQCFMQSFYFITFLSLVFPLTSHWKWLGSAFYNLGYGLPIPSCHIKAARQMVTVFRAAFKFTTMDYDTTTIYLNIPITYSFC